jgi:uncharacterized protein
MTPNNSAYRIWASVAAMAVAAVAVLSCSPAYSQTLRVGTGSAKGTYSQMFRELTNTCGSELTMVEVNSTGSMENINNLVGNQVNAVFVQSDVLHLRARTEELGNVKTLLALHSEQVHLLARASSGLKQGGFAGVGGSEVVFTDLTSLAGRRVGAAGGSVATAQVIRLQSEVAFNVVPLDTNDAVKAALDKGEIDAGLFVGGSPLPLLSALGPQYKLLPISPALTERLKGVYRPSRLTYPKMGAAGVTTVSTDALLVTREYKTERMLTSLGRFRACALRQLDELKETTGTHPAWQGVDAANKGKWAWYDLPPSGARK